MSITTDAQLEDYLKSTGIEYTAIEQLSGGTANFVWRVTLSSGQSRVIKHAEPYIKDATMMLFPVDRVDFEARALTLIPEAMASGPTPHHAPHISITLPTLHHHDTTTHTLHLSAGGPNTLKAAYVSPRLNIPAIGAALGTWLAALHARTAPTPLGNNATGTSIYRYAYTGLHRALAAHGCDAALGHAVNAEFGGLLKADDEGVCHGDFWPGNVLVDDGRDGSNVDAGLGEKSGEGDGEQDVALTVIDWEISRRGLGATDVAQFAAEAYLLDRFRGGRGLLPAFLTAYVEAAGREGDSNTNSPDSNSNSSPLSGSHSYGFITDTEAFVRRAVVHFGVHVAFWPTCVEWGDTGATEELVRLGCEIMEMGRRGDWEGVRGSPVGALVEIL
ncbi:uncharacterized protein K452DRAFT_353802 [Aplosporella prunicola CBS 121167]|uniref:Aminoglycoside phosphotransferase domain-containing protein n=1 Tax=Aplosporella prunicola CBS 121167 TaxID=1176127 RepID=A0A6A6AYD9_9PEZI|nr:uncharacterized protein K452DRAFT_362744 [Aplosporella prunicola CBS 121167]XP_033392508.1 uncharacterized protein K452DRAFT_353802 [Aplosporella prunicola CBS 121167]KAF2136135.1 hypothetical protein K452DRAFT_362744 [Aplosporella prunicola CBS 121167]KAF2136790.1 hypothetical protein K452DRAFT_353802 [Aplosporella prunicola CBS 121167]